MDYRKFGETVYIRADKGDPIGIVFAAALFVLYLVLWTLEIRSKKSKLKAET